VIRVDHTLTEADLAPVVNKVAAVLAGLVANMLRDNLEEMDVRLCADEDGVCWFATGDVSYDTSHSNACEAVTLGRTDDKDAIGWQARALVHGVADQLAEASE
jgi:hypothetical protein